VAWPSSSVPLTPRDSAPYFDFIFFLPFSSCPPSHRRVFLPDQRAETSPSFPFPGPPTHKSCRLICPLNDEESLREDSIPSWFLPQTVDHQTSFFFFSYEANAPNGRHGSREHPFPVPSRKPQANRFFSLGRVLRGVSVTFLPCRRAARSA